MPPSKKNKIYSKTGIVFRAQKYKDLVNMDDLASQNYDFNEIKKLLEKNNYKPVSCISD